MSPDPETRLTEIQDIIAQELDIPTEELQSDDVEFTEIGIDTISSPVIIAGISQAIGLQLPQDVFRRYQTVGALRQHLLTSDTTSDIARTPAAKPTGEVDQGKLGLSNDTKLSVLIRGNPARASKNIFLLPDGSGSAMAYARLQAPSPDFCLYSMHSPFLQDPRAYGCTVEDLAAIWAQEIQRIQPRGPYILGGWSAGGYYAFEAMKHLHRKGEAVEKMILIDSPCRTDFEALPLDVILYLSSHNLMGHGDAVQTPAWLVNHFDATLKAVEKYKPTRMASPPPTVPDVFIIWASDGLLPHGSAVQTGLDLDVGVTRFLLEQRDDFGPNGWEKLFPGAEMVIATMPGNHFNLVHPPNVESLARLLSDIFQEGWTDRWQDR